MIRLRLHDTDLQRLRFAYSPLAETVESLYMVHAGAVTPMHHGWHTAVKGRLAGVDTELLRAVVPPRGMLMNVLVSGAVDARTTMADQLAGIEGSSLDRLRHDLELVWRCTPMPPAAVDLLGRGPDAGRVLAQHLHAYWAAVIEPFWPQIKGVLDGDVAYRARQLAGGGIEAMLADLHPELRLEGATIEVTDQHDYEHHLDGVGLLLIPSAFAWPDVIVDPGRTGTPSISYAPYGIGNIWSTSTAAGFDEDALSELIGRGRAAILRSLASPRSTTELALELGQSPATVSAHLAVLRRSGWATSWRSGRRVLYQRTPLATSVLAAAAALQEVGS